MSELGDMPIALPLGACAASSAAIAGPPPLLPCLERPSRPGACTARIFLFACCCPSSCAHHMYCHTIPASFTRCMSSSVQPTLSEGSSLLVCCMQLWLTHGCRAVSIRACSQESDCHLAALAQGLCQRRQPPAALRPARSQCGLGLRQGEQRGWRHQRTPAWQPRVSDSALFHLPAWSCRAALQVRPQA